MCVKDKYLNKELLTASLAWHYKRYLNDKELAELKNQARKKSNWIVA